MPQQFYRNTIWTNHALGRLADRRLSQPTVWQTFQSPDTTTVNSDGSSKFQKKFGSRVITVIAHQNASAEWVIISCWMDPPLAGTIDAVKKQRYLQYRHGSLLTKLSIQFQKYFLGRDF